MVLRYKPLTTGHRPDKRVCLKCSKQFKSVGPANRICDGCRKVNATMAGGSMIGGAKRQNGLVIGLLLLLCLAVPSVALAELSVATKDAQTVVTVTPEYLTQITTLDGDNIGQVVREVGEPVVQPAAPAVVILLKSDRDLKTSLVKIKCRTADVHLIETGVYVISLPGTHILDVNVISESPLQWDDELVTVTVGEAPDDPTDPPDDPTDPPEPVPVPVLDGLRKLSAESAARLNDSPTAKALAAAIRSTDAELEAMCARGQCPGLPAAKSAMVAAIEQTLLLRPGKSRMVNWLDGWRVPINQRLSEINAVDVPTYRAAMRAVAEGLSS